MCFLFASKGVFKFCCLVFLRSLRSFVELTLGGVFVFSLSELIFVGFFDFPLIEFALDGFLVDPYSYWDSEKRRVYCPTCLFWMSSSFDIISPNSEIFLLMLSATLCTRSSVTMFSLGAECVNFLKCGFLFTTVLEFFLGAIGLLPCLIWILKRSISL